MDLAVAALGTTVTERYGVRAFVACAVVDLNRFAGRATFAAYNGTARVEVSSGEKKIYRPAVQAQQPSAQTCHPHGRGHPDPFRRHPGADLARTQAGRGQGQPSEPSNAGSAT